MSLGWLQLHAWVSRIFGCWMAAGGVSDRAFTLPVVRGNQPYDEGFDALG